MSAAVKQAEVKERPIIFSSAMVRAILEGRKTQTRRVLDSKWFELSDASGHLRYTEYDPPRWHHGEADEDGRYLAGSGPFDPKKQSAQRHAASFCRYGNKGDRLWVRETWQPIRRNSPEQDAKIKASLERLERGEVRDIVAEVQSWPFPPNGDHQVLYAADFGDWAYDVDSDLKPWKSPLFLPRNLSRITLEITNVRAERLQEISGADAKAEGVDPFMGKDATAYRAAFQMAWNEINARRGFSFASNPWVWALSFRRLEDGKV